MATFMRADIPAVTAQLQTIVDEVASAAEAGGYGLYGRDVRLGFERRVDGFALTVTVGHRLDQPLEIGPIPVNLRGERIAALAPGPGCRTSIAYSPLANHRQHTAWKRAVQEVETAAAATLSVLLSGVSATEGVRSVE